MSDPAWTVKENQDGSLEIAESDGVVRGRFRDARTVATHLAFLIQETDRQRAANDAAHQRIGFLREALRQATLALEDAGYRLHMTHGRHDGFWGCSRSGCKENREALARLKKLLEESES